VLGVAVRDVTGDPIIDKCDEQQMTFIGFLLLEDPPKADALDAIVELRQLGVALKIITGEADPPARGPRGRWRWSSTGRRTGSVRTPFRLTPCDCRRSRRRRAAALRGR
jgi:hypothetical protein